MDGRAEPDHDTAIEDTGLWKDAMSRAHAGGYSMEGPDTVARVIRVLSLAAAPTFAVMALLAGVADAGAADVLCAATQHASPINGMATMYALMAAFHSPPWLKLISARGHAAQEA
jgi:hypothetical protein